MGKGRLKWKSGRIIDEDVLSKFRNRPCDICNRSAPSDPHHIKTVGSGGDDIHINILSLCRTCHRNLHDLGYGTMIEKYPKLKDILEYKGWHFYLGKLRRSGKEMIVNKS